MASTVLERLGYGEGRRHAYRYFYCDGTKPKPYFRGVSHEIFFALTPYLWVKLLAHVRGPSGAVAASIFMVCWAAMYGISSQFHRRRWKLAEEQFMSDLDHVGILVMVAGSYFPMTQLLSPARRFACCCAFGVSLLVGARRSFAKRGGPWAETVVAFGMAGLVAPFTPELYHACTRFEWWAQWAALLQFGLGGVIYAARTPDPFPRVFGSQEVFHLLTCTGGLTVFAMNCSVVERL